MKKKIALVLSWPLKMLFLVRYLGKVKFGKGVILNWKFKFRGKGRLIIGDDVNLWANKEWNEFLTFSEEAVIIIGDRCRLNGIVVQARKGVTIGNDCFIGSAILIDNDFHSIYFEHRNDSEHIGIEEIFVEDRVWIGGQAAVLKGVRVGEESVVGFRSVVTKDVEKMVVVAGNPAKVVKEI